MKKIRTVAVLPTMFTLGNLVCGFFAIVVALADRGADVGRRAAPAPAIGTRNPVKALRALDTDDPTHNVMLSGWLIFLAMMFDALDGHVARLSNWTSDFGGQLDSLCDLVTFGVAPAFLLVKMCPSFTYLHKTGLWVIAASVRRLRGAAAGAVQRRDGRRRRSHALYRLAQPGGRGVDRRFCDDVLHAAARRDNPLIYAAEIDVVLQTVLPFFAALVALLMVSRIPYPHVVSQILSGQKSLAHVVGWCLPWWRSWSFAAMPCRWCAWFRA